ncbi:unnamed protein product [Prunus armeniaca]
MKGCGMAGKGLMKRHTASAMPEDALLGAWKKSAHKLWVKRLRRTSSLAELLQVLGDFVGAINEDRLYECNTEQGKHAPKQ